MNNQAASPSVRFSGVSRYFGDVRAVDGIDLEIGNGEFFFTLLGPSGSGKTTCLRMIAGFEQPTAGAIELFGQEVTRVPPFLRDVNTVFQDYALFPHMNVGDNVGYGLMVKRVPRPERERRIKDMLDMVQLGGLERRRPSQLSGGQRQRVALARALINHPRVLLLDEPLGALDLKLRQQMQIELKALQHRVGITFVFVTHDQEEALTLSDRIAVFNHGKIEQVGTPPEIYQRPTSVFVANFVGTSNILAGEQAQRIVGREGTYALRPEKIQMVPATVPVPSQVHCVAGTVRDVIYLGVNTRYIVSLDQGGELVALAQNVNVTSSDVAASYNQKVLLYWQPDDLLTLRG